MAIFRYQTMNNFLANRTNLFRQARQIVRMLGRGGMRREPVLASTSMQEMEAVPLRSLQGQPYVSYMSEPPPAEYAGLESAPTGIHQMEVEDPQAMKTDPQTLLQSIIDEREPGSPTPTQDWFPQPTEPDWSSVRPDTHENMAEINDAVRDIAGPEMNWDQVSLPQPGMDGYSPQLDTLPTAAVVSDAAPTPEHGGDPHLNEGASPALEDIVEQTPEPMMEDPMLPEMMGPDPMLEAEDPMFRGPMM